MFFVKVKKYILTSRLRNILTVRSIFGLSYEFNVTQNFGGVKMYCGSGFDSQSSLRIIASNLK